MMKQGKRLINAGQIDKTTNNLGYPCFRVTQIFIWTVRTDH